MSDESAGGGDQAGGVLEICPFCGSLNHTQVGHCPNIDPEQLAQEIGRIFVGLLRDELTADEFAEMRRRNVAYASKDCCASHEFCDANMPMAAAFKQVGLCGEDDIPDIDSDEICELWGKAWDFAKRTELTATADELAEYNRTIDDEGTES